MLKVIFMAWWKQSRLQNACFDVPESHSVWSWKQLDNWTKSFVFGIFFVNFCAVKVKQTTNILTSVVKQYLWSICYQREVLCVKSVTVGQIWNVVKSWIWSGSLCCMENLCCSKGWIVLNSELNPSAVLTDENCFWTDSSSCSNSLIFFWTDNPSHSNGILIDLEHKTLTNSKRTIFSRSHRHLLVYIFVWEVIIKKRLKIQDLQLRIWLCIECVHVTSLNSQIQN